MDIFCTELVGPKPDQDNVCRGLPSQKYLCILCHSNLYLLILLQKAPAVCEDY